MQRVCLLVMVGIICFGGLLQTPIQAKSMDSTIKLSGPLTEFGSVLNFDQSPDGQYIVYRANAEVNTTAYVYSVPADGSAAPTRLNPDLPEGSYVKRFWISPNSQRVLYVANQDHLDIDELYSVPITGGPPIKLNPEILPDDVGFYSFEQLIFDETSTYVYYPLAETRQKYHLYRSTITTGQPLLMSDPTLNTGFYEFDLTPDQQWLIYLGGTDHNKDIYKVSINGGISYRITNSPPATYVISFMLQSNEHLIYKTSTYDNQDFSFIRSGLYRGSLNGGQPEALSYTEPTETLIETYQITSDASHVVYTSDQRITGTMELFSAHIETGVITRLNLLLPENGNISSQIQISTDSSWVVYRVNSGSMRDLYAVRVEGGIAHRVSQTVGNDRYIYLFNITSDSAYVVYTIADGANSWLYRQPIDETPTTSQFLYPELGQSFVHYLTPLQNSTRAIFAADSNVNGLDRLYHVTFEDSTVTELMPNVQPLTKVEAYQVSQDEKYIFYRADQEVDQQVELYRVTIPQEQYRLYLPMVMR